MAKRVILVDDLTGEESSEVSTVPFMVNGSYYEIELSNSSLAKLDEALAPFVKVATGITRVRASALSALDESQKIRAWARTNGYDINERGRIPAEVMDSYHKANGTNLAATNDDSDQGESDDQGDGQDELPDAPAPRPGRPAK
jgi:Lsr2